MRKSVVSIRSPLLGAFYALILGIAALWTVPGSALTIGGFDVARGGFESLEAGAGSTLANDIVTAIPGTTFSFSNTLTPSFLA